MDMVKVPKGKVFIQKRTNIKYLYLIVRGKVMQRAKKSSFVLHNGNLVGAADCRWETYQYDYVALEECVLYPFEYQKAEDFRKIFAEQPKYAVAFYQSSFRFTAEALASCIQTQKKVEDLYQIIVDAFHEYSALCQKCKVPELELRKLTTLEQPKIFKEVGEWEYQYFHDLAEYKTEVLSQFYGNNFDLIIEELLHASGVMAQAAEWLGESREYLLHTKELLLSENKGDMLELYQKLSLECGQESEYSREIMQELQKMKDIIHETKLFSQELEEKRFVDPQQLSNSEDEADSLAYIMRFVNYDVDEIENMKERMELYRQYQDDYSTDDNARKLRRELTRFFYDVYKKVMKQILIKGEEVTPILTMFLNFGFMDIDTVGEENANLLYELTSEMDRFQGERVYTMYDWLVAIYKGEKEPSRSEFDKDYPGFLREERRMGNITEEQEKRMLHDQWAKVEYEIDNMFQSANRATQGKLSIACPILCASDMVGQIRNLLVTSGRIERHLDAVREIDFSIFYQKVLFSDPEKGVNQELLDVEILPDIILMPNCGNKAMMWQETEGMRRDTPARFVFPIMTSDKMDDMMLITCGRYRWEICRKIQGMRWNDITEKSLTSEYCDYVQFYKKNHDLSPEAKEKLKNALVRAKNNYREIFVLDYCNWIRYESKGSFRLNRVARGILFRYCTFSKPIREDMQRSPAYQDLLQKFNILQERSLKKKQAFIEKYEKKGGEITERMRMSLEFSQK